MPKVTLIVPVYNVEPYLKRCLNSLINQTYKDYEIICINDCSPDQSWKILKEYSISYPEKIKVLSNEKNLGLGKTREKGISYAKGEYLMFIDSDDYISNDYIETYMKEMENSKSDMVIGGYIRDVDGKLHEHKVTNSIWSIVTYPIACAKMFRKDFILDNHIEFSSIRCGEDIFFSLCIFYYGATYKVLDYSGYYYFFNRKSITGSMNYKKNHEEFIASIFGEFMKKCNITLLSKDMQRIIEYTYVANMINALVTYGHGGKVKCMKRKYDFFMQDLKNKFPEYKTNPYYGFKVPKGQSRKIRYGVGITMRLHKMHLDRIMFYIISMV